MLHQASGVSSPLIQIGAASAPDISDRIDHIRVQLDALQQDLQAAGQGSTSLSKVRAYLAARANVRRALGDEMFSDPAWDMLVQLYAHDLAERRLTLSKLCAIARVPSATGQRWVRQLEEAGHVERTVDPLDARKHRIRLTRSGRDKMEAYFRAVC